MKEGFSLLLLQFLLIFCKRFKIPSYEPNKVWFDTSPKIFSTKSMTVLNCSLVLFVAVLRQFILMKISKSFLFMFIMLSFGYFDVYMLRTELPAMMLINFFMLFRLPIYYFKASVCMLLNIPFYFQGLMVALTLNYTELSLAFDLLFATLSVIDISLGFKFLSWVLWSLSLFKIFLPRVIVKNKLTSLYFYKLHTQSEFFAKEFKIFLENEMWSFITCDPCCNDLSQQTKKVFKAVVFTKNASRKTTCKLPIDIKIFEFEGGFNFIKKIPGGKVLVGCFYDFYGRHDSIEVTEEVAIEFYEMFSLFESFGNVCIKSFSSQNIVHYPSLLEVKNIFESGLKPSLMDFKGESFTFLGDVEFNYLVETNRLTVFMAEVLENYCKMFFPDKDEFDLGSESLSCLLTSNCVLFNPKGIKNSKFKIFCSDLNHLFQKFEGIEKRIKKCSIHKPTDKCLQVIKFFEENPELEFKKKNSMDTKEKKTRDRSSQLNVKVFVHQNNSEQIESIENVINYFDNLPSEPAISIGSTCSEIDRERINVKEIMSQLDTIVEEETPTTKPEEETIDAENLDLSNLFENRNLEMRYNDKVKFIEKTTFLNLVQTYLKSPRKLSRRDEKTVLRFINGLGPERTLKDFLKESVERIVEFQKNQGSSSSNFDGREKVENEIASLKVKLEFAEKKLNRLENELNEQMLNCLAIKQRVFVFNKIKGVTALDYNFILGKLTTELQKHKEIIESRSSNFDKVLEFQNNLQDLGAEFREYSPPQSKELGNSNCDYEIAPFDYKKLLVKIKGKMGCKKLKKFIAKTGFQKLIEKIEDEIKIKAGCKIKGDKFKHHNLKVSPNNLNKLEVKCTKKISRMLNVKLNVIRNTSSLQKNCITKLKNKLESDINNTPINIRLLDEFVKNGLYKLPKIKKKTSEYGYYE